MRKNKLLLLLVIACLSSNYFQAQESVHSSGENATGTGGSVSYSIGQLAYTTNTGTAGSIAQGVQQPYEIQTVLGTENFNINLQIGVYPNPTTNWLQLEVKNLDLSSLHYQLYDLNGKRIVADKIISETTSISMENYPNAIYFLKISDENKELKTFKIIKN